MDHIQNFLVESHHIDHLLSAEPSNIQLWHGKDFAVLTGPAKFQVKVITAGTPVFSELDLAVGQLAYVENPRGSATVISLTEVTGVQPSATLLELKKNWLRTNLLFSEYVVMGAGDVVAVVLGVARLINV